MKRILLFLATNVAVLVVLSVVLRLLGIESLLAERGTQLDLKALLVFSAVEGFAGSFISHRRADCSRNTRECRGHVVFAAA